MDPQEFAAERRARFVTVDNELVPSTKRALERYVAGEAEWWDELADDAEVLWREVFESEAPNADVERYVSRFRESIGESLSKTSEPSNPPNDVDVDRVSRWLGTYLVNDATYQGAGSRGIRYKRWTTMHDAGVRLTHEETDGQIKPIGAPFDVGGYDLRFPGDPVGPPRIWINCRCLIQPAAQTGASNVSETTFALVDVEVEEDEDLPVDELEDDEELITEIPVHGVLAPEGVATGDGRKFALESLSHRNLPLPIAYQLLSGDGHSGAATVGRIDEAWREGNEYRFRGAIVLNRQYSGEVIDGIIDGTIRGISVDVDDVEVDMGLMEGDDFDGVTVFSAARIAGVTIVPIPAFQEAFISLGHDWPEDGEMSPEEALAACGCDKGPEEDENKDIELGYDFIHDLSVLDGPALQAYESFENDEEQRKWLKENHPEAIIAAGFAPGTKDGPGWITHPVPTSRIRRYWTHGKGAAKIRWGQGGDFNRCRLQLGKYVQNPEWLAGLCANMHKEALGFWPSTHKKLLRGSLVASGEPAPIFNLVAAAEMVFDSNLFQQVVSKEPRVGVVVDGDHVYGYIAQWGVCHIGISGVCTEAPQSKSDYFYYATGVVDTDKGPVRVGQITIDTGHANLRANAKVAAAHYDNTGSAVADIAVGEDAFGIWFSGVIRPWATDKQRHALKAAGRVSGDWRTIGRDLELVAALTVNVPGFPIPHARAGVYNGEQVSLVAAGMPEDVIPEEKVFAFSAEDVAGIARTAVQEYRAQIAREERIIPLRQAIRDKAVQDIRNKVKG